MLNKQQSRTVGFVFCSAFFIEPILVCCNRIIFARDNCGTKFLRVKSGLLNSFKILIANNLFSLYCRFLHTTCVSRSHKKLMQEAYLEDLFYIARAMFIDENEISAVAILKICHQLEPDNLTISAALLDCPFASRLSRPSCGSTYRTKLESKKP